MRRRRSAGEIREWVTMRTALIALIVLVRFGPDIVYAAGASLPRPASPRQTTAPKGIGIPPAVAVIRPAAS